MRRVFFFLSALCLYAAISFDDVAPTGASTQDAEIAPYLQQHRYELMLTGERLDGPAARWLREEASKAQFFFIGEEHDTREIPLILTSLWPELTRLGYRHAAIEAGQWLGGRLDRFARFKDKKALAQFKTAALPRRPNVSVPPSSEEDIAFYEALGQAGQFRLPLVWGLDHEFRVAPLLARLLELTPNGAQRRQIESALTKVSEAERSGQYNMQPFKREIEVIAGSISARPGGEAAQIQDALRRRVFGNEFDQPRGASGRRNKAESVIALRRIPCQTRAGERLRLRPPNIRQFRGRVRLSRRRTDAERQIQRLLNDFDRRLARAEESSPTL
jgi:hypothetical protein